MVELLAPGVYPIETSFRPASIQAVGTSTTGFVGITRNGPRGGTPRLVTSFGEYERLYGGLGALDIDGLGAADPVNYLAMAVRGFFNEGGTRVYISPAHMAAVGSTGFAEVALVGAATTDPRHMILRSRFPGSGANGTLRLSEIATPATGAALAGAPRGSLARTRGTPAMSAMATAIAAPGLMADGTVLTLAVNGGAAQTVTFTGTPASVDAQVALAANTDIPDGTTLRVTIDGLAQVVPIAAGLGRTRNQIRDDINARLANGTATHASGVLTIASTARGSAVTVVVQQAALLGFTAETTRGEGTGMRRLDAIGADDLNTLLAAGGIAVAAQTVPGTALLRLATSATGNAASLDLTDVGNAVALASLGFDAAALAGGAVTGSDGVARRVFVKTTAARDSWQEYALQPDTRWTTTGAPLDAATQIDDDAHLVSLSLAWESVDGVTTSHEGLGYDADHPRYFGHRMRRVVGDDEQPVNDPVVLFAEGLNTPEVHAALFANGRASEDDLLSASLVLGGGDDGAVPALGAFTDAINRLTLIEDINIVAAPGSTAYAAVGDAVRNHLIGHAQDSNFRIAVCDPPPGQDMIALRRTRGTIDNTYAAFYAPWIRVVNPLARPGDDATPRQLLLPPSGHVAGIYGRNDTARGVFKTPANEIIREAVGFEVSYNQRHQEVLNPIGINVLRHLSGRGNRVYGGRLATSNMEIKYVSDRRYLNFIKQSIYNSMQWAVFEPNGPDLWSDVREAVASFLFAQWRGGALLGGTPEMAYFVRCDRSVITQDDLDNGRLICEVGIAIVKPAEFLVFKIGQKTADART